MNITLKMGKYSACCPNYYLPLQRLSYQEKEDGNVQQKKNYHSIGYRYLAYQPYLSLCIPQCHFMPYRWQTNYTCRTNIRSTNSLSGVTNERLQWSGFTRTFYCSQPTGYPPDITIRQCKTKFLGIAKRRNRSTECAYEWPCNQLHQAW